MAQVNIAHFTGIGDIEKQEFALLVRDVAAREVHGLTKSQVRPSSVSVLVVPIDAASISGADTEVQVYVSGNNWPADQRGRALDAPAAKLYFDELANRIHKSLSRKSARRIYVWVTPFTASGWMEVE